MAISSPEAAGDAGRSEASDDSAGAPRAGTADWIRHTDDDPTARRLLLAALETFSALGYHGTSTRKIAESAGMSPAAVYIRFASKADVLRVLAVAGHQEVLLELEGVRSKRLGAPATLYEMVRVLAVFHARNHQLARVVQYELKSLSPEAMTEVIALRQKIEGMFESAMSSVARSTRVAIRRPELMRRAVLSLCVDLCRWYRDSYPETPDDIGRTYADAVFSMLSVPVPFATDRLP